MFTPKFTITNRILAAVGIIEAQREAVELMPLAAEWEEKFRLDGLVREVYFSSRFDGGDLALAAVEKIVREEPGRDELPEEVAKRLAIIGREKDVQMVMNYRNATKFIDQLARLGKKTGVTFGEKEGFQIHSLLMERILPSNLLGVYRLGQIGFSGADEFGYAPLAVEVPYQMEDFWAFIKNVTYEEIHPVLTAGIAVHELMRMQPFSGGNDGVARALGNLVLATNGYNSKQFFSVVELLETEELREPDLTVFLEYYCRAWAKEMGRVVERVRRLSFESRGARSEGKQIALTERQLALLSAFKMKEELTISEARRVLPMVSDDTILRDLAALVAKKLIKKRGNTKGARYILK